jgi:hypothetical protein
VFLLYSYLRTTVQQNEGEFRGLGYVDSRKDILTVKLELQLPGQTVHTSESDVASSSFVKRRRQNKKTQKTRQTVDKTVDIRLAQDKTALHTRKGDTGSVLWKARFGLFFKKKYASISCLSSHSASISLP